MQHQYRMILKYNRIRRHSKRNCAERLLQVPVAATEKLLFFSQFILLAIIGLDFE